MSWRVILLFAALLLSDAAKAAEPVVQFELRGEKILGIPLAWSPERVFLLNGDGSILDFDPREAKDAKASGDSLRAISMTDLRGRLQRQFGKGFEVSGTGHFLVVHPQGERDAWHARFEELYRSFMHYFAARGWRLSEPRFPLVVVIQPNPEAFAKAAFNDGLPNVRGLLGYYSSQSNRILMFNAATQAGSDWRINAETIIHEAAHQTAFNCGVHTRYADTPRWVTEGLGCLFEARGVHSSSQYPHRPDRLNSHRLAAFRARLAKRPTDAIAQLISSDRQFEADPENAYAEAWMLTFFLSENEPRNYLAYLKKTAALKPCVPYSSPQRLKDFTDVFGQNLTMLDARLTRFAADL